MKCYKVKFLTKDELHRQMIIYAFNACQAKAMAEAVAESYPIICAFNACQAKAMVEAVAESCPIDAITEIKVSETKAKKELIKMANLIDRYYGEYNLYKVELEAINHMRIRARTSH